MFSHSAPFVPALKSASIEDHQNAVADSDASAGDRSIAAQILEDWEEKTLQQFLAIFVAFACTCLSVAPPGSTLQSRRVLRPLSPTTSNPRRVILRQKCGSAARARFADPFIGAKSLLLLMARARFLVLRGIETRFLLVFLARQNNLNLSTNSSNISTESSRFPTETFPISTETRRYSWKRDHVPRKPTIFHGHSVDFP